MPLSKTQKEAYASKLSVIAYYASTKTIRELAEVAEMSETAVRVALASLKLKAKPASKVKITQKHLEQAERRKQIKEEGKYMESIDIALKYNITVSRVGQIKRSKS